MFLIQSPAFSLPALVGIFAAACSSRASSPRGDSRASFERIQPARLADLEAGPQVAGIPLGDVRDVPSDAAVEGDEAAGRLDLYVRDEDYDSDVSDLARTWVLLEQVRGGDICTLRLDYEYRYLQSGAISAAPCAYVRVEPYWGEARGAEARARKLGLELREPVAFSRFDGVLFRTTKPGWYGILGASESGAGTDLVALAVVLRPEALFSGYRVPLDGLVARIRDSNTVDGGHPDWSVTLRRVADEGVPEAATLVAELDRESRAELDALLAAQAEESASEGLEARLARLTALALETHETARESGHYPADAVAMLQQRFGALRTRLRQVAEAGTEDPITRRRAEFLAYVFAQHDPFGGLAPGAFDAQRSNVLMRLVSMGAWIEGEGARFAPAFPLVERTQLLRGALQTAAEYAHPDELSREMMDGFVAALRSGLAEECVAAARSSEAKGLVATACGNFLLAHGLATGEASTSTETFLAARARLHEFTAGSWLDEARRVGLELARRFVPLAEISIDPRDMLAGSYDDGLLLDRTPFRSNRRLGLDTGRKQEQFDFATASGARAWLVYAHDPVVASIEKETSRATLTKVLQTEREVSNDAEYQAWAAREAELLARMHEKQGWLDEHIRMATRDPYLETTEYLVITNYSTTLVTGQRETLESMIERIQSKHSAERDAEDQAALIAEYDRLWAERPSRSATEIRSRLVEYPLEIQEWTIVVKRPVEFVDGGESHRYEGETRLTVECLRVEPNAAIGVEGIDTFRSEEEMRAYAVEQDPTEANFVLFGLESELAARLAERARQLDPGATAEERALEQLWLRYFFSAEFFDDLDSERGCGVPEIEALSWAFPG